MTSTCLFPLFTKTSLPHWAPGYTKIANIGNYCEIALSKFLFSSALIFLFYFVRQKHLQDAGSHFRLMKIKRSWMIVISIYLSDSQPGRYNTH